MALPGISNANEFYSAHYLESVLTGDIKKVRERWVEAAREQLETDPTAEISTPEQRFKALRRPWQKLREAELGISNDPAERLRLQRELFFMPLLEALGYPYAPKAEPVLVGEEAYLVPLLAEVTNAKGEPWLWAVECFNPSDEPADPLELTIVSRWGCQIEDPSLGTVLTDGDGQGSETWEELISERVFGQDVPPRWVLAVSRDQLLLIDRQKWAASRLLRFELDTLLGDNNPDALLAAATLLHREHTCPSGGGTPLLDELDENSHKHAYEVSTDLKYALRRSIELLGNEAITWLKTKAREGVYKGETDAQALTFECLRYMYRLLFLFYIESRPDLGYAPMGSDVYRLGYSLESLRDMDSAELGSEEDKESTYISDSLDRLFQMIWEGYPKRDDETAQLPLADTDDPFHDSFRLTPLKAHLFDPARVPTLSRVRFRNVVLREVIELMSLTKEGKGKRRGRVSYSQLGINQLGAVYEALLSFRGFFAEEDLYEVQPAPKKKASSSNDDDEAEEGAGDEADDDGGAPKASGQEHDELDVGHFVTAERLTAYKANEIVVDPKTGSAKCYPKGSFLYRLAGRDREKSASYYTPESLTQCLVKYALKELLPSKTAAEILDLKVCEPAMGSAAFLNEVVNQLAQAYLELRQQETGLTISHERYATELQKVKMRLADRNVFGIDLNPVAVELAEVSLWLNSIYQPENGRAFVPWFGQQLHVGNSLIGARRQIYRVSQLPTDTGRKAKPHKLWHEHAPEELALEAPLPDDAIFHFLLPDPGMAAYADKVIKGLVPEEIERCKRWQAAAIKEPFSEQQIRTLQRLSRLVDGLWQQWIPELAQVRERTTDPLPVWEEPGDGAKGEAKPLSLKDRIQAQEVAGEGVANANARLRLKLAMDYWCALWFWPLDQARLLPSREDWLLELSMVLGDLESSLEADEGQLQLLPDTQPKQLAVDFSDRHGYVNKAKLLEEFPRLQLVQATAELQRFLHWDLEFADVLKGGGFDLIVGNPPWIQIQWKIEMVLSDHDPISQLRSWSTNKIKDVALEEGRTDNSLRSSLAKEYVRLSGAQNFLGATQNYSLLRGQKANLYKCFLLLSFRLASSQGIQGLLHPDAFLVDPSAASLRKEMLHRYRDLFAFRNSLFLFRDISDTRTYCISVLGRKKASIEFLLISKLFHPSTIDSSIEDTDKQGSASSSLPPIKDRNFKWNTLGHPNRVVKCDAKMIEDFDISLGNRNGAPSYTVISVYSQSLARVLSSMAKHSEPLGSLDIACDSTNFNETPSASQGIIKKGPFFPLDHSECVYSGSHISPLNLRYKAPKQICNSTNDYSAIDLSSWDTTVLPRFNYIASSSKLSLQDRTPLLPWSQQPMAKSYRLFVRRSLDPETERTLQAAIAPPGPVHLANIISLCFKDSRDLVHATALIGSLPYDFFVKSMSITDIRSEFALSLPFIRIDNFDNHIVPRVLSLSCVNSEFASLWSDIYTDSQNDTQWTKADNRLEDSFYSKFSAVYNQEFFLRSAYARRQALLEIDVLVAIALGITLNELVDAYFIQFSRMRQYESETHYDANGNIVFIPTKGFDNIGFPRKGSGRGPSRTIGWEDIQGMTSGTISRTILNDTLPGGPVERTITYEAPFDRCDRVEDYRVAWGFFSA